ncbi:DUF4394 domain-containing protein [Streptomyces sp. NBC_01264]|uniref:DUF4394 domain-containing protein n=1 Tax=Streptomyces sp. NBC_01264 TaxID=2903804 RepID=UPI0022566766|nr:DUF4394 domain-containing protein [Streptomyces sp. NBC_01264]MCX4784430.1 DUF4394 domain-containing protein [Streptomyces sp. NBC_01264]
MNLRIATAVAAAALAAACAMPAAASANPKPPMERAPIALGLTTDMRLVEFPVDQPSKTQAIGKVTGLRDGDTKILAIDFRIQDGKLYGLGDGGGVYVLDTENAQARRVCVLTLALQGTAFGFDFDAASDNMRIVSDTGQNLTHDLNTRTTTSHTMLRRAETPNETALGVTALGYTNNDTDESTDSTAFVLDTVTDRASVLSPGNDGLIASLGDLGRDIEGDAGFDIRYNTVTGTNTGYSVFKAMGRGGYRLASVNILNGQTTELGTFGASNQVRDIAVTLDDNTAQ